MCRLGMGGGEELWLLGPGYNGNCASSISDGVEGVEGGWHCIAL